MFSGLNPKKMQAMMKQLGINQQDIDADRVIIEKPEGKIIIENPKIKKINMQGQETFQISGDIKEESEEEKSEQEKQEDLEQDISTIAEKTGCSKEEAAIELEKNKGDIAQTIINLGK